MKNTPGSLSLNNGFYVQCPEHNLSILVLYFPYGRTPLALAGSEDPAHVD